ncbi:MAG: TetR/AcrR family transcriptional regulator [Polyangia bacterium]
MIHAESRTPRERRHDDNLRRILDAAMRQVEEGGFAALSVNKLAEEVDYTPGALYRYFGSKDALLSRLIERVLEEVRADLARAQALLPEQATPLAHVLVLVSAYRAFAKREPHRFGLLAMSLAEPRILLVEEAAAQPVTAVLRSAMRPLGEALAAAARAGQLTAGHPAERTICVFAFLQGLLPLRKRARSAPKILDVDHLAVQGTRALLLGWGARPRAVDAAIAQVARLGDFAVRRGAEA